MIIYTETVRTINIGLSPAEAKAVQTLLTTTTLVTTESNISLDSETRKLASDIFNGLRVQLDQTETK